MVERTRRFNVLLSEEELSMLKALAARDGIAASDYVRLFIRRSYAEAFSDKPPKKPKPKH